MTKGEVSSGRLPLAVFLMGPTGAGKTQLAVDLVRRLPVSIVSVDSAMVYRGLDIGTAKPDPETLKCAPHRLIDICDPGEAYSAARFRTDALREMRQITASGRIPLLVGGTGLYFRRLERGIAELPEADTAVRARLVAQGEAQGWRAMHRHLAAVDPEAAARIHPNDPQRIQRALEVYEVSGRSLSNWLARQTELPLGYRVIKVILAPSERGALHERIEMRFRAMLAQGLIQEVQGLRARGDLHPGLPAMRTVGYRDAWSYLEGRIGYERMVERAIIATRQLAKRQLTWLRAESEARWFEAGEPDVSEEVLKYLLGEPIFNSGDA